MDGVLLPVPAARDGVAGAREVVRLPVLAERHDVQAMLRVRVGGGPPQGRREEGRIGGLRLGREEQVPDRRFQLLPGRQADHEDQSQCRQRQATRRRQPRQADGDQQRHPEDHEEAVHVVAERQRPDGQRQQADDRVGQKERDEVAATIVPRGPGKTGTGQSKDQGLHDLVEVVEVRGALGEEHPERAARHQERREPRQEEQVRAAHPRLGDEVGDQEDAADQERQRIAEQGQAGRQRRRRPPPVCEQHEGGKHEGQGEEERVLAVAQVQAEHDASVRSPAGSSSHRRRAADTGESATVASRRRARPGPPRAAGGRTGSRTVRSRSRRRCRRTRTSPRTAPPARDGVDRSCRRERRRPRR